MAFNYLTRPIEEYFIQLGDRVEIKSPTGDLIRGKVTGRGAAGIYIEVKGDDGQRYSGHTSDQGCRKIFSNKE